MKQEFDDTGSTAVLEPAKDKSPQNSGADKAEMMEKMEVAGAPGPAHKALGALVGKWNAEVKCFMEPGGAPQVNQATAKTSWALNGRFVEGEFHGEMMGKPFIGRSLMGFDNTKQKFISAWVSDIQTSMFTSEGKGDSANKVITLEGKGDCPATGRKDVPMKQVFHVLSPDKYTFEMFDGSSGKEVRTMEITYTRQ